MNRPSFDYVSFVVRLWREPPGGTWQSGPQWLAQLETLPGGEKYYFVTPETLLAHLMERLAVDRFDSPNPDGDPTKNPNPS